MRDKVKISLMGIGCITILSSIALIQGVNSLLASLSISVISGIAGYVMRGVR